MGIPVRSGFATLRVGNTVHSQTQDPVSHGTRRTPVHTHLHQSHPAKTTKLRFNLHRWDEDFTVVHLRDCPRRRINVISCSFGPLRKKMMPSFYARGLINMTNN